MYQGQLTTLLDDIRGKARMAGGQNMPSSNATTQSQEEDELDAEAKRWSLVVHGELNRVVGAAKTEVDNLANNAGLTDKNCIQLAGEHSLEAEAQAALGQLRPILLPLKVTELRRQADLNYFKQKNDLRRDATYPDSLWGHLSFVFAALALEAVLNAWFFKNELGILGGALIALFVSIVNLVVAAFLGVWFRYTNHVKLNQRILGWSSLAVFLVWSIYFNALISTYRFHYQEVAMIAGSAGLVPSLPELTEAFQKALGEATRVFLLDPPFRELESFLLFFVGVFLAIFAFYKGYTSDDPYPGYSKIFRPYDEAKKQIQPAINKVYETLTTTLSKRLADIQNMRAELMQSTARLVQLKANLQTAGQQCNSQLERVIVDHAGVRQAYRQTNVSIRTTPPPAYFATTDAPIAASHDGGSSTVGIAIDAELVRYQKMQEQFLQPLLVAAHRLQAEAAQLYPDLFAKFQSELTSAAQRRIAEDIAVISPPGAN